MAGSWNDRNGSAEVASTVIEPEPIHLVETLHQRLRSGKQDTLPGMPSIASITALRSLYLNLLKKSLTNTLFNFEPDVDDDEFVSFVSSRSIT